MAAMKNILVPTDFSLLSLDQVGIAAKAFKGKCSIILFHAFDMPESLIHTISRTGIKSHYSLVTEAMRLKCRKVKSESSNISEIAVKFMYGTTLMAFRNYVEANDVDFIFLPDDYRFVPVVGESVDPTQWFKKSGVVVLHGAQGKDRMEDTEPNNLKIRPQQIGNEVMHGKIN